MEEMLEMVKKAKYAAQNYVDISTEVKNDALIAMANAIEKNKQSILVENQKDLVKAKDKLSAPLIDRLKLNEKSLEEMVAGLRQIAKMEDPIGEIIEERELENRLLIKKVRVPLGVVLVIYESRPNVTVDTVAVALKAGNVIVLKGGSDALNSNKILVKIISEAAYKAGIPENSINLIESVERSSVDELLNMNKYIDVVVPRGGHNLIQHVLKNATVPVLETGEGNCHIYIDNEADLSIITPIVINAKTQRPGTCNAVEKLLVHKDIAEKIIPNLVKELEKANVEVRGDRKTKNLANGVKETAEDDWETEYLDLKIAIKIVDSIEDAIAHINEYGTKHSEAIITTNKEKIKQFMNHVDAAAIYSNASTRFTDGFQLGMGAEVGISTQKLHARGPMGIKELTTYKLEVFGNGQTRK